MDFTPLIYTALPFFLFLFYFLRLRPSSNPNCKTPPEPAGALPFLGHLSLLGGGPNDLLHVKLGSLAEQHGPIFNIRVGTKTLTVVSSSKLAKELFTTNDVAVSSKPQLLAVKHLSNNFAAISFAPYGDYWRQIRKISTLEVLSNRRMESLIPVCDSVITQSVKELHTRWKEEKDGSGRMLVDMKKWFADLTLNVLMKMTMGKQLEGDDLRQCRDVLREAFYLVGKFLPADAFPLLRWFDLGGYEKRVKQVNKELNSIVDKWMKTHRQKGDRGGDKADDFLDAMISAAKDFDFGGLHDPEIVINSTCQVIMLAGSDTTSTTLVWVLSLLLNHRQVLIKVQQELDKNVGRERRVNESDIQGLEYLHAVIKECLRLYPPGSLISRKFDEDCTVGGYHVTKGSWLMLNLWAMHRDPKVWSDSPLEFIPERFLTTQKNNDIKDFQDFILMPFGAGRRMCPGMKLGLHELHFAMATLLQGFEFTTISDETLDMTQSPGFTNIKATPLEVFMAPRLAPHLY